MLANRAERYPSTAERRAQRPGLCAWVSSSQPNVSARVYDRPLPDNEEEPNVIDRLREQLQERLDQLLGEADRLRKALAALDPRSSKPPARKPAARNTAAATEPKPARPRRSAQPARRPSTPASSLPSPDGARRDQGRRARGARRRRADDRRRGRRQGRASPAPTVSTTLSKLAKSGEVQKAERGYRLASAASATPPSPAAVDRSPFGHGL